MDVRLQNVSLSEIGESVGSPPNSRFTSNVRRMGVVQPVLLAETVDAAGEIQYIIIDGNRRIHAARKAKLRDIPSVVITDITDVERAQLTLVANGFRSPNYLTEFWALKTLERSHFTLDDVTKISGMSDSVMATRQRLSHLQRELFIGLRNGKVSQTNAITVANMDRHDQAKLAKVFSRNRRLLKRDVDNQVAEINARTTPVQPGTIPELPPKIIATSVRFVQKGQTDSSFISDRPTTDAPLIDESPGSASSFAFSKESRGFSDLAGASLNVDTRSGETFIPPFAKPAESPPFNPAPASLHGNSNNQHAPKSNALPDTPPQIPTTASRAVMHMRSAVIAAHLLDFSKAEFLEMAGRIWDESVSRHATNIDQFREEHIMHEHTPTDRFPDLAAHKWDTGES